MRCRMSAKFFAHILNLPIIIYECIVKRKQKRNFWLAKVTLTANYMVISTMWLSLPTGILPVIVLIAYDTVFNSLLNFVDDSIGIGMGHHKSL